MVCGQVLATKENLATRRHYLNQQHCMSAMLAAGVIPIVNENDTVSLTELMFTDNDELSGLIASMMDADVLIILSNIDGIFDGGDDQITLDDNRLTRIIEAVAQRAEMPMEKVLVNIEHTGNTSAASIPLCLDEYKDKLKKGDRLVLTAFGAGFTWGAMYLVWDLG